MIVLCLDNRNAPTMAHYAAFDFTGRTYAQKPSENLPGQEENPMARALGPVGVSCAPPFTTQTDLWESVSVATAACVVDRSPGAFGTRLCGGGKPGWWRSPGGIR
jgi:hypothetical protein